MSVRRLFWRVVRWLIREPDFSIDQRLLEALQKDFDRWVTPEWFAQLENRVTFMGNLQRTLEGHCRDIDDVKAMLHIMQRLKFTPLFAQVRQSGAVGLSLTSVMSTYTNAILSADAPDAQEELKAEEHKVEEPVEAHLALPDGKQLNGTKLAPQKRICLILCALLVLLSMAPVILQRLSDSHIVYPSDAQFHRCLHKEHTNVSKMLLDVQDEYFREIRW